MLQKTIDNFSLDQICRSGQCFRMREEEEGFYSVIAGDRFLRVRQDGKNCSGRTILIWKPAMPII